MSKGASKKSGPPVVYQIHVEARSASGLPARERAGPSDPYVLVQLLGGSQKVMSRPAEDSVDPVWQERLAALDGFFPGNDVLKVTVLDRDRRAGGRDDDALCAVDVPVRSLAFGRDCERSYGLARVNRQGKPDKKAKPGAAGTVALRFSVAWAGRPAWADAPWTWPLCTAVVDVVSATGVPSADFGGKSDPYVVLKLAPALNSQKTKTRAIDSTLTPVWDEQKTFVLDGGADVIAVTLYDRDAVGDDDRLATGEIPLADFAPSALPQERDYPLKLAKEYKGKGNPVLKVRVKLTCDNEGGVPAAKGLVPAAAAPDAVPAPAPPKERVPENAEDEDFECHFEWKSYSSSWSSISSKYAAYGQSLSSLHEGEDGLHNHLPLASFSADRKGALVLSGTVIGAAGLPKADSDGTDSYVIVNIANKDGTKEKKKNKSETIHDTSDPKYGYPFEFGVVHRGQIVEFTIFQSHKLLGDQPIAYGKQSIAQLELDSADPVEIELEEPTKFQELPWKFTGWGTLTVAFTLKIKEDI
jgi:hypothetical protein